MTPALFPAWMDSLEMTNSQVNDEFSAGEFDGKYLVICRSDDSVTVLEGKS